MTIVDEVWSGIGGDPSVTRLLEGPLRTTGALPSSFAVEAFGAASFAAVGLAIAELTGEDGQVTVDPVAAAAALRSEAALRIGDEEPESVWDPLSRMFHARDGWVRLHGNYEQHRAAIEDVFSTTDRDAVAAAIANADASGIEMRVHAAGGVAALAHTLEDWQDHGHGSQVTDRPLIATTVKHDTADRPWRPAPPTHGERAPQGLAALAALASAPLDPRPLRGLRVLELTRVIAGPVAGRTLSWFGADVLRIESPDHRELRTLVVDTGQDKRSTRLDLRTRGGRDAFEELLAGTDVLLHGLRPGALGGLGFDAGVRARIAPGLIDASLSAYGPGGTWSARRGFDSLVQLSTGLGLAEADAAGTSADGPRPLPCQILDHATGLLLAAAIIRAAGERAVDGHRRIVVGSLARTAAGLVEAGRRPLDAVGAPAPADPGTLVLEGDHGRTRHAPFPVQVDGVAGGWHHGARTPGEDSPRWSAPA
ncbi:MAG: CoA transferase [Solirubrobacteraceae bacterium]|nr:CoA transferase [Solirubrobacteraceae bacterium]